MTAVLEVKGLSVSLPKHADRPYAVQNIDGYVLKTAADVLEATTDHLRLKLNLSNLDDAGRDDARRKLAEAMAALDRSGKAHT